MKKASTTLFILLSFITSSFCQIDDFSFKLGERISFQSAVLDEERSAQIYLPASYHFNPKAKYPVVYLMDGDYNFHHDSGLLEFMSSVGEKIPEMILVGISDKGSEKYRSYCSPTLGKDSGEANKFMAFIEEELKPFINNKYRTSEFELLIGHSMGGLFVTNYFLEMPTAFDNYIAIDPSLWKNDHEIVSRADSIFTKEKKRESQLFISLANTKMMGVFQFVGVLDKHFPMQDSWNFYHFENETHGSCHLPTIKKSLEHIFENWAISWGQLEAFESPLQITEHYMAFSKKYSIQPTLPPYFMGGVVYHYNSIENEEALNILEKEIKEKFPSSLDHYQSLLASNKLKQEKYDEAEKIYQTIIERNNMTYGAYDGLSKLYTEKKDLEKALMKSEKSIEIAKKGNARQWMLNELNANQRKIKCSMKE